MSKIQGRFSFSPSAESLFKSMLMLSTSMLKLPLGYGYQNILYGPFWAGLTIRHTSVD